MLKEQEEPNCGVMRCDIEQVSLLGEKKTAQKPEVPPGQMEEHKDRLGSQVEKGMETWAGSYSPLTFALVLVYVKLFYEWQTTLCMWK